MTPLDLLDRELERIDELMRITLSGDGDANTLSILLEMRTKLQQCIIDANTTHVMISSNSKIDCPF